VVVAWIGVFVVGNAILAGAGGAQTNADFALPDVESTRGTDILEHSFGGRGAGFGGTIVFIAGRGDARVDDPALRRDMQAVFDEVAAIPGVAGRPPLRARRRKADRDPRRRRRQDRLRHDRLRPNLGEADYTEAAQAIRDAVPHRVDGARVELGGQTLAKQSAPTTEALGVAFAIVILVLAFGSVLAMGLPIGVAIAGIATGSVLAGFLSFVVNPPSFASIFGVMIGLGVGIDYALFIVTATARTCTTGTTPAPLSPSPSTPPGGPFCSRA
jgi:RND superfamily putative drug exporter